jgi:tRNA uridine 5-carboxymethylaminomethyl modification enzyme
MNKYDVIVIGAGHAGCEAGLAAARMGLTAAVFTISLDGIANMPCNPCVGGSAKGQIVGEIDALGGEMGKAADATMLQSRMLNKGKGAAVHSLRVQCGRQEYHTYMKHTLEQQDKLYLIQDEVTGIAAENGRVCGVKTKLGKFYSSEAVIITTGTYLNGKIFTGEVSYKGGPDGTMSADLLSDSLRMFHVELKRFKTGTPPRVHKRSVDFDRMELQKGDDVIVPFSFDCRKELRNVSNCFITYTNEQTHRIILENITRSAMYSGKITGTGPRYCPSIEDKIVRFTGKDRHQLFVEPVGLNTEECYIQGMSTSLPPDVQEKFIRSIAGLERAEIMRYAYAIEYDCCDTTQLLPTLEFKQIKGLYGAGQFNGTSGYEEAAGQGLLAGINAALAILQKEPLILHRNQAYIGVLIDDLVTKGTNEPYRMMTSRAEFRLTLRQDNAPERLAAAGYRAGLLPQERYDVFLQQEKLVNDELSRLKKTSMKPADEWNRLIVPRGTSPLTTAVRESELLKRPQVHYKDIAMFDNEAKLSPALGEKAEIKIKYEGYVKLQEEQAEKFRNSESLSIPDGLDYSKIDGLRLEAREKLDKLKPVSIGQAYRISGVNPADVSVLMIYLQKSGEYNEK